MSELDAIYQEALRVHYEEPHNFGPLPRVTASARASNPVCGDEIVVHVEMTPTELRAASFEGHLCAISRASASLMTDAVKGRTSEDVVALRSAFAAMMQGDDRVSLGDLDALKGVRRYRVRQRCALLPWEALGSAVEA